jgi:polysaccharide biosynthesis transport protein
VPTPEPTMLADERGGDVRHYLAVLRGRFWTILACFVVVFSLFTIYTFRATPIYEATTRVVIERSAPRVAPFEEIQSQDWYEAEKFFATQMQIVVSRAVMERALEVEDLANRFKGESVMIMQRPSILGMIGVEIQSLFSNKPTRPTEAWERLKGAVQVKAVTGTSMVEIRVSGSDPNLCREIVNAVAEAYVTYSNAARQKTALETLQVLGEMRDKQDEALKRAAENLKNFQGTTAVLQFGPGKEENPVLARLKTLNDESIRIQLQRTELAVSAEAVKRAKETKAPLTTLLAVSTIKSNPAVKEVLDRLIQVQLDTQAVLSTYGPKHPRVQTAEDQQRYLTTRLNAAIAEVADSVAAEYQMAVDREQVLKEALDAQNALVLEMSGKIGEYDRLKSEVDREERMFDAIVNRVREVDLTKESATTSIRIAEKASTPRTPIEPNKSRAMLLGAFLGLLLGLGVAVLLEYLDDTVKTPEDIEQRLGVASLGYVPAIEKVSDEYDKFTERAIHTLLYPHSSTTDAFRSIKTNIYFSMPQGELKSLMVTSPQPGDGKTVFASNLAVTMALEGKRVLLVDADLRRPSVHTAFGLKREEGLSNVLVEGKAIEGLVQCPHGADQKKMTNLHVLTAGARTPNPAELLGGESMARFIADVRRQYDVVIYDMPPIIFVADNAPLARAVDGVALVLRAGRTRREAGARARKQIEALHGKLVGIVLNVIQPKALRGHYYYYGYYYYGYHKYYKDYGKDRTKADSKANAKG